MKTKTIILIFLALMISNSSCFKEKLSWSEQCLKTDYNPNVLPKETQTGENRLGCLIDGKVFANSKCPPYYSILGSTKPINCSFYISAIGEPFWIFSLSAFSRDKHKISIIIWSMEFSNIGEKVNIDVLTYNGEKLYSDKDCGKNFFTKIDTVNKIISGRFEGKPKLDYSYNSDEYVTITDGRFDIKYE